MGNHVVITRERLEFSRAKLEKLLAKDPWWQDLKAHLDRFGDEGLRRRGTESTATEASRG